MNWVDLTVLAVLALFGLRGYFRGLFREIFSVAGLVVGFVVTVRYYETVAALGGSFWSISPLILKGAAYVAIFFVVYFFFNSAGWLLHRSEKALFLQTLNRIGGIAVGIGKGAAVTALMVFFAGSASWLPHAARDKINGALLAPPLSRVAEEIIRAGKKRIFPAQGGESASADAPFSRLNWRA